MIPESTSLLWQAEDPSSRTMNVAFEGMSGTGKSHWSDSFNREYCWPSVSVDACIAGHPSMVRELELIHGNEEKKLGRWLGHPGSPGYPGRERVYLAIESEVLERIAAVRGSIIDLSGSSAFHEAQMQHIAEHALIVYLDTKDVLSLVQRYVRECKPVCWMGKWQPQKEESFEESVRRLLPQLIETRIALYEKFADVVVPEEVHLHAPTARDLTRYIARQLS